MKLAEREKYTDLFRTYKKNIRKISNRFKKESYDDISYTDALPDGDCKHNSFQPISYQSPSGFSFVSDTKINPYFPIQIDCSADNIHKLLGKRWKQYLESKIRPFCEFLLWATRNDGDNENIPHPISTVFPKLIRMFKNPMEISRVIAKSKKIGLISTCCDRYRYSSCGLPNISKTFYINRNFVLEMISLCDSLGIEYKNEDENNDIDDENVVEIPQKESKNINLKVEKCKFKRINQSCDVGNLSFFEKKYIENLNKNYPMLPYYQDLREDLNKYIKNNDEKGVFNVTFTISYNSEKKKYYITKVGIRDWNVLCTLKNKNGENDMGEDFESASRKILGNDIVEYDQSASVPHVLNLLKTGKWEMEKDFYEEINGGKFDSAYDRDCCKSFCLRATFQTVKQILSIIPCMYVDKEDIERAEKLVMEIKAKMDELYGDTSGSECFLYESCIYMDVEHELQKRGYRYLHKYDAFYFSKKNAPSKKDFDNMVRQCAENFYNKWFGNGEVKPVSMGNSDKNYVVADIFSL